MYPEFFLLDFLCYFYNMKQEENIFNFISWLFITIARSLSISYEIVNLIVYCVIIPTIIIGLVLKIRKNSKIIKNDTINI